MLGLYRAAWTEAGHDPDGQDVHMSYNCYLAEDATLAHERGKTYSAHTNRALAAAVELWARTRSEDYPGYGQIVERVRSSDFGKQLRDNKVLVGSPDEVADRLRLIRAWFGDITISLQVISGN